MAEAEAASVPARAGTILGVICSRTGLHRHLAKAEPWLRPAVPLMLAVFLASVVATCLVQGGSQRASFLAEAHEDIEALARLASVALSAPSIRQGSADPAATRDRLAGLLPFGSLAQGRRLLIVDPADRIVATLPGGAAHEQTLTAHLGEGQPLTVLGGRAGVMTLTLASGERVLATVQDIPDGAGRIAVIHPLSQATAGWRASMNAQATLLCACALVIVCMGFAYTLQAARARESDDICERVRQRVDTAFRRGRCGLWDWDVARGAVYWSDSMYDLLGYARKGEFLSFGEVNDLVHPQDGDLYGLARDLAAARHHALDHEFRLRDAHGGWVWLKARAEVVSDPEDGSRHLVGIFVDITEQRRLAEAGAASDARLRDAVEAISEAFVLWDSQNRLVLCNSKFRDLHRLPSNLAIAGRRYSEVMSGGTAPTIRREIPQGEAGPTGGRAFEAELADGRWLQISERRTKDGGYVSVGTDISALKRQQDRLVESEKALLTTVQDLKQSRRTLEIQAQQLADIAECYLDQKAQAESANAIKSDFLAKMSHELRTPLNAVIGFADLMERNTYGALGSPKYTEYCRDIRASGEYLLSFIEDILAMSRLDAKKMTIAPVSLRLDEAVDRCLPFVAEPAREKRIVLEADVPTGARITADERSLQQIVVNLLQNAVKFTPEGGRVRCKARASGGVVNIFVEDSGIGIPARALPKLGQPFEQVETAYSRNAKGSGLGLAIARSLAELHGGSLRIRSQVGIGTIVLVRLPLPGPVAAAAPELETVH